jgi:nucleoside-diphosphate-sugar epimerase
MITPVQRRVGRRRVLVTGAGGKVAARIVEHLRVLGWDVVGFDQHDVVPHPHATSWRVGDLANPPQLDSAMSGVDAVVHAAAVMGEDAYTSSALPFRVNVAGTYDLLESARRHGVRRVALLSEAPVHLPRAATDRAGRWRSSADSDHLYDLTKRLQEEIGRDFAETFGMAIVALRLGHVVDGAAQRDMTGKDLTEVDYCRGGWVCCHDVASATGAALTVAGQGFMALPIVGSRSGRERFDVPATEETLGIRLQERFGTHPDLGQGDP